LPSRFSRFSDRSGALASALVGLLLLVPLLYTASAAPDAASTDPRHRLDQLHRLIRSGQDRYDSFPVRLGPHTAVHPDFGAAEEPGSAGGLPAAPGAGERAATTNWNPYAGELGVPEAAHLLRRTVIGPQWEEIQTAAAAGLDAEMDTLLGPRSLPDAPGEWATEPVPDVSEWTQEMIDSLLVLYNERAYLLMLWWSEVMLDQETSITESMTLFWHDHFATGVSKVIIPQSMYVQNDLLRRNALGNFRELVRQVAYDPAMLLWLDGQVNRVGNINENWARELLELFTLGVDQYTQQDIVEAARAFTGWVTYDGITSVFVPGYHDYGYKVFMGQGGFFDGDDIINIIFMKDETARFICRKLYRWFIDEFPDEALIEDLAQTMRDSDYEILPVLERMLGSEHFFDTNFRGSVITDPMDRSVGSMRSLYVMDPDWSNRDTNPSIWLLFGMQTNGLMLFEPPNVAGWPGYRTWINSYTLPWRKKLDVGLIDGHIDVYFDMEMQADVLALAGRLTDPNDPFLLIDELALYLFGLTPTELVRQRMIDELLQGAEPWEWNINHPAAEGRLRDVLKLMMRLPDYQLK
jgi:hypothetical protein